MLYKASTLFTKPYSASGYDKQMKSDEGEFVCGPYHTNIANKYRIATFSYMAILITLSRYLNGI